MTITLYKCSSPKKGPTTPNSKRIIKLRLKPTKPAQTPKKKYRVPISLWFVEDNQRKIIVIKKIECKSILGGGGMGSGLKKIGLAA